MKNKTKLQKWCTDHDNLNQIDVADIFGISDRTLRRALRGDSRVQDCILRLIEIFNDYPDIEKKMILKYSGIISMVKST